MHARSWDIVARGLADRYRVLALDQRGHGETNWAADYHEQRLVEDLADFIKALELVTVSLVGFSMGGSAACSYATLHPDRVARLVVLECVTDPEVDDDPVLLAHLGALRALPGTFATPKRAAEAFRSLAPYAAEEELRRWMRDGLMRQAGGLWGWRVVPILRRPGSPGRLNAEPQVRMSAGWSMRLSSSASLTIRRKAPPRRSGGILGNTRSQWVCSRLCTPAQWLTGLGVCTHGMQGSFIACFVGTTSGGVSCTRPGKSFITRKASSGRPENPIMTLRGSYDGPVSSSTTTRAGCEPPMTSSTTVKGGGDRPTKLSPMDGACSGMDIELRAR
jgi:pimeloyl-ACP methyl ester carboxylesterase